MKLVLPFPPSSNRYWRAAPGRGLVPSDEALAYKARVAQLAIGTRPLKGALSVELVAFRPRRTGDLDNVLKVLFDALSGVAWIDDGQVEVISATRRDDPARPRVEIEITGGEPATAQEIAEHRSRLAEANRKRRKTLAANRQARKLGATPAVWRPR